ncbi:zinc finger CCCH domain-containing protein 23-like [Hibiscus syriacus]|uniref:zinc finger CCCH domain-containing protein 23-like n=1 Tax=Hibiscus syriacus TaxID=106335 RepID=UPI0019233F53|nr:zinc finger CCCH domain-containing protein 23-like [Hibiscus syriacus]
MVNPASRQIFPADSTFREEDVSNYFSIYRPVQDVRIPYQQKRMFGFNTFVTRRIGKSKTRSNKQKEESSLLVEPPLALICSKPLSFRIEG